MQKVITEKDGCEITVFAEKVGQNIWFHYEGRTVCIAAEDVKHRGKNSSSNATPGQIVAPMPGKILKLNVSLNDEVKKDQVVVIMEAMKMEYSLVSDIDGQVTELKIAVGDQVPKDQVLVQVSEKN
ncbi:MAG: acetyl-CoA carboxylase biotin carboxyl carrier protein subunit [Bdellovibrionales bacterium]